MFKINLAALLAVFAVVGAAGGAQAASGASECFYSSDWHGWKATEDSRSIYIRVGATRIYRLDLSAACPLLMSPDAQLITEQRGSSSICTALDIDLSVTNGGGIKTPCVVSQITPLSPQEASALPKRLTP